jgi:small subunit ribosomal protein S21
LLKNDGAPGSRVLRKFYAKPAAGRKKAAAVKCHFKRLRSQTLPKKFY